MNVSICSLGLSPSYLSRLASRTAYDVLLYERKTVSLMTSSRLLRLLLSDVANF